MITRNADAEAVEAIPGLIRRTLAQTESLMLCEFTFEAHVKVPIHTHPNEQVGYIVVGSVEMTIDGKKHTLNKGDSYCVPSNLPHGALSLEPTIIVDTFNPPREDYK